MKFPERRCLRSRFQRFLLRQLFGSDVTPGDARRRVKEASESLERTLEETTGRTQISKKR